jgi:hypothetical protein
LLRQQFRKQTVLRRTKKRRLRADQKHSGAFDRKAAHREPRNRDRHHTNFHQLRADHNAALAVTVREIASGHREENKRQRKQRAHHQHQKVALALRKIHCHDDVNDEEFNRVVVERVLKLRNDQRPKSALPIRRKS